MYRICPALRVQVVGILILFMNIKKNFAHVTATVTVTDYIMINAGNVTVTGTASGTDTS